MVSTIKLTSTNIDKFEVLCNKKFNKETYDRNFFEIYKSSNFLYKMFLKKSVLLFESNKDFIGYIWFEPEFNGNIKILSMYIPCNYLDKIKEFTFFKNSNLSFQYEVTDSDDIVELLPDLGFFTARSSFFMETICDNFDKSNDILRIHKNLSNNSSLRNLLNLNSTNSNIIVHFMEFDKVKDIELRCNIQNNIFENEERTPLKLFDIENDIKQEYYIDNLSIFILINHLVVGYGQIIYIKKKYTIVNFGIISEFRGLGLSKILLDKLIMLAKENNIKKLFLRVDEKNSIAISLYKWANFKYKHNIDTWEK